MKKIRSSWRARLALAACVVVLGGCSSFAHYNASLDAIPPIVVADAGAQVALQTASQRATFKVDANRGNPRVLFFLALSGGGSRASYLSAATMLRLQTVYEDEGIDLLREVDVVSSVSGGSVTGAYYAISYDDRLPLKAGLAPMLDWSAADRPSPKLEIDKTNAIVTCNAKLDDAEQLALRNKLAPREAAMLADLCENGARTWHRRWNASTVNELMQRNYANRWMWNWLWPDNVLKYWFTAFDRSDIMAQTLEDNLYDAPTTGLQLNFADLNPQRPYLIINATNASQQYGVDDQLYEPFAFGSVFTFTEDDFRERLRSDVRGFSVARAVMASAAFPLVFANATLRDFRAAGLPQCQRAAGKPTDPICNQPRYLHVFDGGNSDNLGLRSVKRAIFELIADNRLGKDDKIVVMLVDAFTKPGGASRTEPDPRGAVGRVLDTNLLEAVDALLQANRANRTDEFASLELGWRGDCVPGARNFPAALCERLDVRRDCSRNVGNQSVETCEELKGHLENQSDIGFREGSLTLDKRMVFYHFGFDDVEKNRTLKEKLDSIPTSFSITTEATAAIDEAISLALTPDNSCLALIRDLVTDRVDLNSPAGLAARRACKSEDVLPQAPKK